MGQDVKLTGSKAGATENGLVVTEANMISEHCVTAAAAPAATVTTTAETISTPAAAVAATAAAAPAATVSTTPETVVTPPSATPATDATVPAAANLSLHQLRLSARLRRLSAQLLRSPPHLRLHRL